MRNVTVYLFSNNVRLSCKLYIDLCFVHKMAEQARRAYMKTQTERMELQITLRSTSHHSMDVTFFVPK